MRGLARTVDLQAALAQMDLSNRPALEVLRAHQVSAATDVTGFGLVGHLAEMLDAAGLGAELWLASTPALPGALQALQAGAASVLQPHNERALDLFEMRGCAPAHPHVRLLAESANRRRPVGLRARSPGCGLPEGAAGCRLPGQLRQLA